MSTLKKTLTDKVVSQLPLSDDGQYIVRDTDLPGFFVRVGARTRTFTVQAEFWKDGKRKAKTIAIGSSDDMTTRDARVAAKAALAKIALGELQDEPEDPKPEVKPPSEITLREAWARYKTAHLERKNRSPATIAGYTDDVERLLADWLDRPLRELGEEPSLVSKRHDDLTVSSGPYGANGCMRTLRAIYNHARKSVRGLPPENPVTAVDWNEEERRDCAMGKSDLPGWMAEAGRLRNPIRREFHLFMLLSGSRPTALKVAKITDLNLRERFLHIPAPKGGKKKAFDIELSRQMICCLMRAMRVSRMLHPEAAKTWIFAADGEEGHISEQKEDRAVLSKWGNDLRHTYRTIGQEVLSSPIDMHLLMNHSVKKDVNTGYITRSKLRDHLRASQQALSDYFIAAGTVAAKDGSPRERAWPLLPARRIGDEALDPTPPDRREGVAWSESRRKAYRSSARYVSASTDMDVVPQRGAA